MGFCVFIENRVMEYLEFLVFFIRRYVYLLFSYFFWFYLFKLDGYLFRKKYWDFLGFKESWRNGIDYFESGW